jgi:integrase
MKALPRAFDEPFRSQRPIILDIPSRTEPFGLSNWASASSRKFQFATWQTRPLHHGFTAKKSKCGTSRLQWHAQRFYHLALLTGMRRAELGGLQWSYVDLVDGRVGVVKALQRISGKGLVESQPKTARSCRSISLSPDAVSLLHEIRGRQIAQQTVVGEVWQSGDNVFTQTDGRPVDPDAIPRLHGFDQNGWPASFNGTWVTACPCHVCWSPVSTPR